MTALGRLQTHLLVKGEVAALWCDLRFKTLVHGESGHGVGALPDQGGGKTVVKAENALAGDHPLHHLQHPFLAFLLRLEMDFDQVERMRAAGSAHRR